MRDDVAIIGASSISVTLLGVILYHKLRNEHDS
jgi:hypothetical protein